MASHMIVDRSQSQPAQVASFERFGGLCALLAGAGGLLYAIAFVIVARSAPALGAFLSALLLTLNGLLATSVMTALYQRLRSVNPAVALWSLVLASVGALGATIHGGYDLANAVHPPAGLPTDLPNPVDPRGLLTFGVSGIALLINAWLMRQNSAFPRGLGLLTYLLGALLLLIYLARLIILSPANPFLLAPVLLTGFVANPAWYIWMGRTFLARFERGE